MPIEVSLLRRKACERGQKRAPHGCWRTAVAAFGVTLAALAVHGGSRPAWLWNTTASAPIGLYRLRRAEALRIGEWLAIRPPSALAEWLDARGDLPRGVLLLKQLAAVGPSQVCRQGAVVRVNGHAPAVALAYDRRGLALPVWRGCRQLGPAQIFVLNDAPASLDSRYFGALPVSSVVARAIPWATNRPTR